MDGQEEAFLNILCEIPLISAYLMSITPLPVFMTRWLSFVEEMLGLIITLVHGMRKIYVWEISVCKK